jgi:hypothetical protein
MRRVLCLLVLVLGACDDDSASPKSDLSMISANADLSASVDLSMTAHVDRGPTDVTLDFEPVGLYWDSPSQALYVSTGSNQILKWTDDDGFSVLVTVPFAFAAQGNNLSQLVRLADGRIAVDVIGVNGTAAVNGNILLITAGGAISAVPNLIQTRQRQGLALASDGTIYSTWFQGTATLVGGVSKVDLTTGETDVWLGLQKPYGIVAGASSVFVADQKQGAIFDLPFTNMDVDGGAAMKLATVTTPDLMTLGPGGDLFVAGPSVSRVKPDGTVSSFALETRSTRGVAYDGDHQRLFVAEPDAKFPDAGPMALLHILPVD